MKSIVKLIGVTSCCLVGGVAAANAEPMVLADAELDRVAAGSCADFTSCPPGWTDTPGYGLSPGGPYPRINLPSLPLYPFGPTPVEGPGCNTGGGPCQPSPFPLPWFGRDIPSVPSFWRFGPIGFGGGCVGGPAATCPTQLGPTNGVW